MDFDGYTIKNVIICENVRQEKNDKYIIIGVFPADVLVSSFPARLQFAAYIEIDPERLGRLQMFLRVYLGDSSPELKPAEVRIEMEIIKRETLGVATPSIGFQLNSANILRIDASSDGNKWISIASRNINLNPIAIA